MTINKTLQKYKERFEALPKLSEDREVIFWAMYEAAKKLHKENQNVKAESEYAGRFIEHLTSQGVEYETAKNEAYAWIESNEMGEPSEDAMDAVSNWDND